MGRDIYTAHVKPLEDALAKAEENLETFIALAAERASNAGCLRAHLDKELAVRSKAEKDLVAAKERERMLVGALEESRKSMATLRNGMMRAISAANLALFVIEKHGVMPNDSWRSGFNQDISTARAALASVEESADA